MPQRRSIRKSPKTVKQVNNVKKLRELLLMSKAELAQAAGISLLTVMRIEKGAQCRMATKRKIIKALGLTVRDNMKVFGSRP